MKDRLWTLARIAAAAGFAAMLASPRAEAQAPPPPIQDNSFLVEEAYNQERGVVQTILTYQRVAGSPAYVSTLTQEWPAPGIAHQISLTVPLQGAMSAAGLTQGLGDAGLNYRFQVVGDGVSPVAFSPRATLLLPTGNSGRNLGTGGFGAQVNLPLSLVLSPTIVAHTNLGATRIFSARATDGSRTATTGWNAGQSFVWLTRPAFNVLLEAVVLGNAAPDTGGRTVRSTEAWVSPGVRAALNLPGGLQVVPGLAVPVGIGPSRGKTGLFLYLSAELPVFGGAD